MASIYSTIQHRRSCDDCNGRGAVPPSASEMFDGADDNGLVPCPTCYPSAAEREAVTRDRAAQLRTMDTVFRKLVDHLSLSVYSNSSSGKLAVGNFKGVAVVVELRAPNSAWLPPGDVWQLFVNAHASDGRVRSVAATSWDLDVSELDDLIRSDKASVAMFEVMTQLRRVAAELS